MGPAVTSSVGKIPDGFRLLIHGASRGALPVVATNLKPGAHGKGHT